MAPALRTWANGDKSNFGATAAPLVRACKSEIGLIPLLSPWDARARSSLRIRNLAREIAIVNDPRRARRSAPNSIGARPHIALSCPGASLCAARCWNYYAAAKNPCARVLRKNPKNPLEGCAQLESPSRLIHNRQNLSRIPSWELRAVRIGSPAVNSFLTITSGETPVTPQDPFAADFLWAEKKTQTGYSRPAGPP